MWQRVKRGAEKRVAAHETVLWLELASQVSGWTETDLMRSKSGADMVAAPASRPLDAFAIERPGRHWVFVVILARIVRVRRATGFWNRPLAGLFGPNVSWKLPGVGHPASAECSPAELERSTSPSVGGPLPGIGSNAK